MQRTISAMFSFFLNVKSISGQKHHAWVMDDEFLFWYALEVCEQALRRFQVFCNNWFYFSYFCKNQRDTTVAMVLQVLCFHTTWSAKKTMAICFSLNTPKPTLLLFPHCFLSFDSLEQTSTVVRISPHFLPSTKLRCV